MIDNKKKWKILIVFDIMDISDDAVDAARYSAFYILSSHNPEIKLADLNKNIMCDLNYREFIRAPFFKNQNNRIIIINIFDSNRQVIKYFLYFLAFIKRADQRYVILPNGKGMPLSFKYFINVNLVVVKNLLRGIVLKTVFMIFNAMLFLTSIFGVKK